MNISGQIVQISGQSMFVYLSGGSVSASISGQPVSTSVSGNIVEISGQAMYMYISGGGSSVSGSAVTVSGNVVNISGQPVVTSISGDAVVTSISGQMVWGTGTSGQVQVQTTSGSFVTVSGTVSTSVSGNTVTTSISGNVVQISGQFVSTSISGNAVITSVSGDAVLTSVSGNVISTGLSGASFSGQITWGTGTSGQVWVQTTSGSYVSISGAVSTSVSGNVVLTSISGNVITTSISGNVVQISGQSVSTSVSGNVVSASVSGNAVVTGLSGASFSGQITWGIGTSGQVQVITTSGSYVSISGTVAASVSGNVVVTSVSGNVVITSVSGNVVNISGQIVQISGQAVFVYVSGGSFSADVSGNVVWGYGTSGQMPVFTVSGSWVTISGSLSTSTVLSGGSISGVIVWGYGTSGQLQVQTESGSFVTVSGTVLTSVSGNAVTTSVSGNVVSTSVSGDIVEISGQVVEISGQSVYVYISGGATSVSGSVVTVSGNVVVTSVSGNTVGISISGGSVSGQYVAGYDVGGFYPGTNRLVLNGTAGNNQGFSFDRQGNLIVRGAITTDEGAIRDGFVISGNVIYHQISGIASFTSGSTIVTLVSGTFINTALNFYDAVQSSGDSPNQWGTVASIDSATQATLWSPYIGSTTTSGLLNHSHFYQTFVSGGGYTVQSGGIYINAGVLASGQTLIRRLMGNQPMVFETLATVSQRISGQNCYIGFFDDPQNPGDFARFNFSGTVTTSVGCETGYTFGGTTNGTGLDTFEAQLPSAGITSLPHTYRIEFRKSSVVFLIDGNVVYSDSHNIPNPYSYEDFAAGWINSASAPLTSSYLFLDYVYLDKTDTIQVVNQLKGSPIPISIVSGLVTLTASISGQAGNGVRKCGVGSRNIRRDSSPDDVRGLCVGFRCGFDFRKRSYHVGIRKRSISIVIRRIDIRANGVGNGNLGAGSGSDNIG